MSPIRRQVTYSRRPNRAARNAHARGDKLFRTYDTSYIQPKHNKRASIIGVVVLLVVLVLLLVFIFGQISSCMSPANSDLLKEGESATISIEQGQGASDVGNTLVSAKLISAQKDFTDRVDKLGAANSLQPGSYTFSGGTSVDDIIKTMQTGSNNSFTLTVPEGYKLGDIATAVQDATGGKITADAFKQASSNASVYAQDYQFLADAGTNTLEGFLFPKTYTIEADASAESVVRKMLDQFKTETASLDFSYPTSCGLNMYDAVKLASIVEKESSADSAIRAKVASVFYNRLNDATGPTAGFLQSDATTAYEVGHDPTAEEVHDSNSAYSTYTNQGLPPTPICSPSIDCLRAVCSPDQDALNKYYFFYFEGDNYVFSETYEEHQAAFSQ